VKLKEDSTVAKGKGESRAFEWIWRKFALFDAKEITDNSR